GFGERFLVEASRVHHHRGLAAEKGMVEQSFWLAGRAEFAHSQNRVEDAVGLETLDPASEDLVGSCFLVIKNRHREKDLLELQRERAVILADPGIHGPGAVPVESGAARGAAVDEPPESSPELLMALGPQSRDRR